MHHCSLLVHSANDKHCTICISQSCDQMIVLLSAPYIHVIQGGEEQHLHLVFLSHAVSAVQLLLRRIVWMNYSTLIDVPIVPSGDIYVDWLLSSCAALRNDFEIDVPSLSLSMLFDMPFILSGDICIGLLLCSSAVLQKGFQGVCSVTAYCTSASVYMGHQDQWSHRPHKNVA